MSAVLSEHLPLLASAPDGIQKLRGLIYEIASRGMLVDTDASIPARWVKLGDVAEFVMGQAPPGSECNTNGVGTIFVKTGEFGELFPVVREWTTKPLKFAKHGDVLICVVGATVGKLNLAIDCAIGRSVAAIRPSCDLETRYLYASLVPFTLRLRGQSRGSAQGVIGKSELAQVPIRLPSLPEQHRIVARVDELMALCDRLEAEQADAAEAHARLVDALLATLTASRDAAECAANWQRLHEHFNTLFTTEASITALKQTILQLAVMGRLVPQHPTDEPASELLKRIEAEKARLVKEGKVRKPKTVEPVGEDERPFEVPNGWQWARWDAAALKIGDIDHKMPDTVKEGIPYVSPRDFFPGNRIDFEGAKKISRNDFEQLSSKIRPEVGDIIYPRYGTIGENRLVVDDIEFLASYSCCVIKTMPGFVAPKFQFYFSISKCCRDQAKAAENKTTQANVGIKSIQEFTIPLPPLPEQHRIVAKVDELMALCDRLQADLATARDHRARLADTLVQAALEAA